MTDISVSELRKAAEKYVAAQHGWDMRESLYPSSAHVAMDILDEAIRAYLAALTAPRVVALTKAAEALLAFVGDVPLTIKETEKRADSAVVAIEAAFTQEKPDVE